MCARQWDLITPNFLPPSAWITRFAELIPDTHRVVDLAAGSGRHSVYLADRGFRVLALDLDAGALELSRLLAKPLQQALIETRVVNLEEPEFPRGIHPEKFAGLLVTNYLYRPHFLAWLDTLVPGGVLLYETFAVGNEEYGRPTNPEFLLEKNELLARVMAHGEFDIVAFEHGFVDQPKPAITQRICAIRR